jgi:uncharacterized protein
MDTKEEATYTAFAGMRQIATGDLRTMLGQAKQYLDRDGDETVLIFEDRTGRQIDFDFRGTIEEVWERTVPQSRSPGPGRPRLGVIGREVSLLPSHWAWLEAQPNGASAALRRLVEEARKRDPGEARAREAVAAAGRFMWAVAGNLPNFEEASRALYGRNHARFRETVEGWPADIRAHLERLTEPCFAEA